MLILTEASLLVAGMTEKSDDPVLITADGAVVASDSRGLLTISPAIEQRGQSDIEVAASCLNDTAKILRAGSRKTSIAARVVKCEENGDEALFTVSTDIGESTVRAIIRRGAYQGWAEKIRDMISSRRSAKAAVVESIYFKLLSVISRVLGTNRDCLLFTELLEAGLLVRTIHPGTGQSILGFVPSVDTGKKWLPDSIWERKILHRDVKRRLEV